MMNDTTIKLFNIGQKVYVKELTTSMLHLGTIIYRDEKALASGEWPYLVIFDDGYGFDMKSAYKRYLVASSNYDDEEADDEPTLDVRRGLFESIPIPLVCKYRTTNKTYKWVGSLDIILAEDIDVDADDDGISSYHDEHYKDTIVEPIFFLQKHLSREEFIGFLKGNIWKYRIRAGHKGKAQDDIDKALRYEQWLSIVKEGIDNDKTK